mgnify:CR=1 FL=1
MDVRSVRPAPASPGRSAIAAAWGPFPRTELEELKPDYLFDEPRDLLSFLGK